jgi:hypothetical protein
MTMKNVLFYIARNGVYLHREDNKFLQKLVKYKILIEKETGDFCKGVNYFIIEDIVNELLDKQQNT